MRKWCVFFMSFFCVNMLTLQAIDMSVAVKAGYFTPTSGRVKHMFSGAGLYGAELDVRVYGNWHAFAEVGNYSKSGRGFHSHRRAHIHLTPIAVGAKYVFDIERLHPYLGIGLQSTCAKIHNHARHMKDRVSARGFGGILKAGFQFDITSSIFCDLFVSHLFADARFKHKTSIKQHRINTGGTLVGLGIGYRW